MMDTVWSFACGVAAKWAEGYATGALLSGMNPVFTAGVFAANEAVQRVIEPVFESFESREEVRSQYGRYYVIDRNRYFPMIKLAVSAAIVAGTAHALGYAPIVMTAAKATTIGYTLLATTGVLIASSAFVGNLGDYEPAYLRLVSVGSICAAVITATVYGWSPIALGAIAAANVIAPEINDTFKGYSHNLQGLLGNTLGWATTRAYKRTLVAVLTVGALHYAGQVAAAGDIRSRTAVAFVTALIGFVHA